MTNTSLSCYLIDIMESIRAMKRPTEQASILSQMVD
jgi:hypothetical protein